MSQIAKRTGFLDEPPYVSLERAPHGLLKIPPERQTMRLHLSPSQVQ